MEHTTSPIDTATPAEAHAESHQATRPVNGAAPRELYLCIDGGGTKTSVSIAGKSLENGGEVKILGTGQHRSSNHTGVGLEQAMVSIGEATLDALRRLPDEAELTCAKSWTYEGYGAAHGRAIQPAPFARIWAGLSGVDGPEDLRVLRPALASLFGLPPSPHGDEDGLVLRVTNDCDLLSSAIERVYKTSQSSPDDVQCQGGIVLIAGTGSIATAFGPKTLPDGNSGAGQSYVLEAVGRMGGYGYLLGDEGSAYYVGHQTIKDLLGFVDRHQEPRSEKDGQVAGTSRKPMGAHDTAIERSSLLGPVRAHFQIDRLANLMAAVYAIAAEHERKLKIAELSRLVMHAAFGAQPDAFARTILERAGERLSELVRDLCALHELKPPQMVLCLGGGMWSYPQFKLLVLDIMRTQWDAHWGWVETIDQPDQLAAISLV
ncbi:hypothetical protein PCASD_03674 [Puccinia coronata f. sp. avenae]|uniref:N-acetylglucosamine kinase n=1 Tax=Puccinia coronata f. sp. avenae TaxID=200324 RepID=A0A2N5V9M2_9BASI|nr:hypothetical protein PCASD_03674 [Puccinia coronata f. sp. avenae]